jgi:hypothetical protein
MPASHPPTHLVRSELQQLLGISGIIRRETSPSWGSDNQDTAREGSDRTRKRRSSNLGGRVRFASQIADEQGKRTCHRSNPIRDGRQAFPTAFSQSSQSTLRLTTDPLTRAPSKGAWRGSSGGAGPGERDLGSPRRDPAGYCLVHRINQQNGHQA